MKSERGSATLLVLTLVGVLSALVMANAMVIHHLRAELRQIDHQQQARLGHSK